MFKLAAAVGVTDNGNAAVELFPVNWSLTTVVPAEPSIVISVAEVCVSVIPVPSVRFTTESLPVPASKFKGTLVPDFAPA